MGCRIGTWLVLGVVVCGRALPASAADSNSLMDITPDGARLAVANPDNGSVSVVDTRTRQKLFELGVGDKPEGVSWVADTPVVLVALYGEGCVLFVDAEKRRVLKKLHVAPEPYGIVTNRAGTLAWVTHEYPGLVSEIDLQAGEVRRELPAGRYVRGLALSPDEKRLFVTEYYTAFLNQIDLSTGTIIDSWKGHTTDNLCRHVAIHPRRPKAYLSHIRSRTQVASSNGSIFPHLSICDLVPANGGKRGSLSRSTLTTESAL